MSGRSTTSDETRSQEDSEALVLTEIFPPAVGGSGELLKNVYERIGGVRVTVLSDRLGTEPTTDDHSRLRVVRTPMRTAQWGVMHPAGLRHHVREASRLRRLSRRGRVVVHCARALPEGVGAWAARRMGGARYVCWAHGEDIPSAQSSRELAFLMGRVFAGADAIIANSRNTAGMLEAAGAPVHRIEVVHPGVDAQRFRPAVPGAAELRARLAPGGEVLLLTVGRLQRRKGHDMTLRALAGLVAQAVPVRYVIVGDGAERTTLERLSAELGVTDRVTFAGVVPADALPVYYAAADVFVHPNRVDGEDIEGFGIVFLEAAAAGLPVVAGASGGVPEAVEANVTGLLVSGTDADELGRVLNALGTSPERRKALGSAGRLRVQRDFSWERAAGRVRAIHDRIAHQW